MVHTVTPLFDYAQVDLTHYALWIGMGIVVVLLAMYFKSKITPKNFR